MTRGVFHAIPLTLGITLNDLVFQLIGSQCKYGFHNLRTMKEQHRNSQPNNETEKSGSLVNGGRNVHLGKEIHLCSDARMFNESVSAVQGTSEAFTRTHPVSIF